MCNVTTVLSLIDALQLQGPRKVQAICAHPQQRRLEQGAEAGRERCAAEWHWIDSDTRAGLLVLWLKDSSSM